MDDRAEVKDTESFNHFDQEMNSLVSGFDGQMQRAANNSASPAQAGGTDESAAFMTQERQARDTLAKYLTQTSQGLHGYRTAVGAISDQYGTLITVTTARMNALLRPGNTPTGTDPMFNWPDVLNRQAGGH